MVEGSWVGLDVHARSTVAGVLDGLSGELRVQRVPPESGQTVEWLRALAEPVRVNNVELLHHPERGLTAVISGA